MTDVTYKLISLADLALSPLNARFGRAVETADLETSIPAGGRLVTPLDVYPEGRKHLVYDGGRRLLALQALAKAKKLPASLGTAGVPCLVHPNADAAQVDSLATFVRAGMTAGDEFLAIQRLVATGLSLVETAAALNLRTPRVHQLQRLVALCPQVLEAFTTGKIPLDVAEAFTLTDSHDRQREILKVFNPKKDAAWGVRQQLRKGAIDGDSRLAKFVGREAYLAAGGTRLNDLFTNPEQEDCCDPELLDRPAMEKLEALRKTAEAEGWEWVEARTEHRPYDWGYKRPFDQLPGKKATFTLEQKASAGAIIFIGNSGAEIERGLVKKAPKGKTNADGTPAPAIDQALYGYGHGGHEKLTQVATGAVQVAIALDPAAAYDTLLTSVAWTAFRENGRATLGAASHATYDSNAASLRVDERGYGFQTDDVAGMAEVKALAKAWRDRLPDERVAFCEFIAALTPDEKAILLAISTAWTLNAVEHRFDGRKKVRWAHLGWIAARAKVDLVKAWTPDLDLLKKASREALGEALKQMGGVYIGGSAGEKLRTFKVSDYPKKADLVSVVFATARKVGWAPKLLADLVAPAPTALAAKPARKPKDQMAADIAKVVAETKAEEAAGGGGVADAGEAVEA